MDNELKQINALRDYAKTRKGELADVINAAADTIEELNNSIENLRTQSRTQSRWIPFITRPLTELWA